MELQKLLTSQTLTKLEPRNLAKTCSSMGYLAVIDSVTSEVRILRVLDGKDVRGFQGNSPRVTVLLEDFVYLRGGFFMEDSKKEGLGWTWNVLFIAKRKKRWWIWNDHDFQQTSTSFWSLWFWTHKCVSSYFPIDLQGFIFSKAHFFKKREASRGRPFARSWIKSWRLGK